MSNGHLTTLSISVLSEFERMWKVVAKFKISRHLPGGGEENNKNLSQNLGSA
jgi:hypothetical protein